MCGLSIDPIVWIYNADLLPDRGIGICSMINLIFNFIIVLCFPFIIDSKLALKGTFFTFSLITLIGFIYTSISMKETKGKIEPEIEEDFR